MPLKSTPLWLLALIAVFGCNRASPTQPDSPAAGVAATVNGEAITLPEYYEHTGLQQTAQVMSPRGPTEVQVMGNFGLQSLQELVDQKVLMQMAKEGGVTPTDADVDAELKFQIELQPNYVDMLEQEGLTMEMIRRDLMVGLAREHLIMKGVKVEPAQVDSYIKAHPERFTEPAKATLVFIQVNSKAREVKVDAELATGKNFASVAAGNSEAPHSADPGNIYPVSIIRDMPLSMQEAVNKTPEKQTTGWVTIGQAFLKFYVEKKSPAKLVPPTPAQKELVRRGIAMQKGQVTNDFNGKFFDKLRTSTVDVQVPYLKDAWSKTWNQLSLPGNAPTRK